MSLAPEVVAAFEAGAGIPLASIREALALVLGALAVTWLAWAVSALGARALGGRVKPQKVFPYMLRAAAVVMLVIFVLM